MAGGNTWVISDPHFGHENICKFTRTDGTPLRPWDNAADMDAALVSNWNRVVKDDDRVYLLGDVAMSKAPLRRVVPQLKGRIALVMGNHDIEKGKLYAELFDDVRGYVIKKGFIMSHIPLHPGSLGRWKINIHGHLHSDNVTIDGDRGVGFDHRYVNVCVEQINYTPKLLSKILEENGVV